MRSRITRRIRQTISKIPRISGPRSRPSRTTRKTDVLPLTNGNGSVVGRRQAIDVCDWGLRKGGEGSEYNHQSSKNLFQFIFIC